MASAFSWIKVDETAKAALARILTERPSVVLPPPLHRLALRVGNVVEIVGPSPSAKTLILIQTAINCILPKEWKGVQYGGLERPVLFVDLDCRFDVLSLSRALERRVTGANRVRSGVKGNENEYDKELFVACMSRFLYTRCYNSFEFLATLKTLPYRFKRRKKSKEEPLFQTVVESIVQEIQRLLLVHPMLVLAAKSAAFGDKQSTTHVIRNSGKRFDEKVLDSGGPKKPSYRDYMPWGKQASDSPFFHDRMAVATTEVLGQICRRSFSNFMKCLWTLESEPVWVGQIALRGISSTASWLPESLI
ncbi:DNA repair protein XRCC2 [Sesamum angolense]|uniref:DNA repair protein XRCC2 n=1 Tax=Sesamum angolense TaxID=2727404 RepID=A0AAE1WDF4_9LAMI|nr:DNA repair protein XRCC2 [Sesamum angolense]